MQRCVRVFCFVLLLFENEEHFENGPTVTETPFQNSLVKRPQIIQNELIWHECLA